MEAEALIHGQKSSKFGVEVLSLTVVGKAVNHTNLSKFSFYSDLYLTM